MIVLLALLAPVVYSYTTTMLQPSSLPLWPRSVEWLRAHHGNWLVDEAEHYYYSWQAPSKGGPQLTSLPTVGVSSAALAAAGGNAAPADRRLGPVVTPPTITRAFAHRLPGEGVWRGTGPLIHGRPPVLVTTFRTEVDYPRIVAYVAWFDHTRTSVAFYPGRYEPPSAPVRGPMSVPNDQRWRLLATFNGGFIYRDGNNGSSIGGRQYEPLKAGLATLVAYRDGRVDVKTWNGGPVAGTQIAFARQSLPLIVDHGRLNPALNDSSQWGYTLGNAVRVWRTGAGIDRHGNLIYAAADFQTVDHAGEDPATRRRRARDAARHQPGMADTDHLRPPRRPGSGQGRAQLPAARDALPRAGRPRLLRRVPAPARARQRAVQVAGRRRLLRRRPGADARKQRVERAPEDRLGDRRGELRRLVRGREPRARTDGDVALVAAGCGRSQLQNVLAPPVPAIVSASPTITSAKTLGASAGGNGPVG